MWLSRLTAWLLLVAFYHWVDAQDQNSFSDATSQQAWKLAYYSTTVNPDVCIPKMNPGWKLLSKIELPGAPIFGQAWATVSVSETLKYVHVHFRGSDAMTTFIMSGYMYLLQTDFPTQPFEGMSVAQEFAKTFTTLWQGGLRTAINSAWDEYCDFPIWITGHSVGACLAQMMAVKVKKFGLWDYNNIILYSYQSPRCGHQPFALAVNAAAATRYQIRLPETIINLPATTCTSLDPANPKDCYWHAGYGIQYSKGIFGGLSGPSRCATGETTTCLAGNILQILNHAGLYSPMTYGLFPPTC